MSLFDIHSNWRKRARVNIENAQEQLIKQGAERVVDAKPRVYGQRLIRRVSDAVDFVPIEKLIRSGEYRRRKNFGAEPVIDFDYRLRTKEEALRDGPPQSATPEYEDIVDPGEKLSVDNPDEFIKDTSEIAENLLHDINKHVCIIEKYHFDYEPDCRKPAHYEPLLAAGAIDALCDALDQVYIDADANNHLALNAMRVVREARLCALQVLTRFTSDARGYFTNPDS